ncbi:myristylated tegument protein [Colobine gammaherpesvirus 1]|uniref:Cytoplasmic envelopment protein 3 n=1 Tax=Colobine gammaherpesvirus 1 TaxID=2597325 RepID=A0A5B8FKD6_9GAMA|nr:myristylated tegument protein [Colobine gammaherpesvirus 1]QDQ69246.1 myristylated tegument protein [Colobine gammaherpesvirus 1]
MGLFLSVCKRTPQPVDVDGEPLDASNEFEPIGNSEKGILLLDPQGKSSLQAQKKTMRKNKQTRY